MKCPRCKKLFDLENRKAEKLECSHHLCSTCVETAQNRTWKCPTCKKQNDLKLQVSSARHHKVVKVEKPTVSRVSAESKVPNYSSMMSALQELLRSQVSSDSRRTENAKKCPMANMSLFYLMNKSLTADGFVQKNELIEGVDVKMECYECDISNDKTNMKICKTCYDSDDLKKFSLCTDCSVSKHLSHDIKPFLREYASYRIEKACENDETVRLMIQTFERIVEIGRTFGKDTNKAEMTKLFRSFKFFMISFGLLERSCLDDEECEKFANESIYPQLLEKMEQGGAKGNPEIKKAILLILKGNRICPGCGVVENMLSMMAVTEDGYTEEGIPEERFYMYCQKCRPFGSPVAEHLLRTPDKVLRKCFGQFQVVLGEFKWDAIVDAAERVLDIRFFSPFVFPSNKEQPNEIKCIECYGLFPKFDMFVCQTCADEKLTKSNGLEFGFYHFEIWALCGACKRFNHRMHRTYDSEPLIAAYPLVAKNSGRIKCFADVLGSDRALHQRMCYPVVQTLMQMKKELAH